MDWRPSICFYKLSQGPHQHNPVYRQPRLDCVWRGNKESIYLRKKSVHHPLLPRSFSCSKNRCWSVCLIARPPERSEDNESTVPGSSTMMQRKTWINTIEALNWMIQKGWPQTMGLLFIGDFQSACRPLSILCSFLCYICPWDVFGGHWPVLTSCFSTLSLDFNWIPS